MAKRTVDRAKEAKKDEFYTQLEDINNELRHYREHFRGKTVLCNCDDPRVSNFFTYFAYNFEFLGLKKLITTCYKNQDIELFSDNNAEKAVYLIYEGDKNGDHIPNVDEIGVHPLKGDGDFRSAECIELLKEADIVVTNPPFSLFREYVAQLIEYDKKFLIIGHQNALSYKVNLYNKKSGDKAYSDALKTALDLINKNYGINYEITKDSTTYKVVVPTSQQIDSALMLLPYFRENLQYDEQSGKWVITRTVIEKK